MGPVTTDGYREIYDKAYKDVMSSEAFFDIVMNGFREHADRFSEIMRVVRELKPVDILDMPCGWGLIGAMFRWQRGYAPHAVHGVDISKTALAFAKARMRYEVLFEQDVVTHFDLKNTYDLVLCMEIIEHVHEPEVVIQNAFRHSHKHVLFTTPVEEGPVDGTFHVRHVEDLKAEVEAQLPAGWTLRHWFFEGKFGEKPHWKGWNFVLAERGE